MKAAGSTFASHAALAFLSRGHRSIPAAMALVAKWAKCKSVSFARADAFTKVTETSPALSLVFKGTVRSNAPRASNVAWRRGRAWCSKNDANIPRPPLTKTKDATSD